MTHYDNNYMGPVPNNSVAGRTNQTYRGVREALRVPQAVAPTVTGQNPNSNPSYLSFLRGAGAMRVQNFKNLL